MRLAFVCLVLLIVKITPAQELKHSLTIDDVFKQAVPNDPHVSPDGNWLLYTITTFDTAADKRNTDIWMSSWDGKEHIQLSSAKEAESTPRWSPDGKFISFITVRGGDNAQIFLMNRKGGEGKQLTELKADLQDYQWSKDSKKLLLTVKDAEDTSLSKKPKPYVIDRYQFKQDVVGYRYSKRKTHLYLFDIETKKIDTLTKGDRDEWSAEISPDGKWVAYITNKTEDPDKNSNSDIYVVSTTPGSTPKQVTNWTGSDDGPQWSPDGKSLAYLRSTSNQNYFGYDQSVLCTIAASGGEPNVISLKLDRPVSDPHWSIDGKSIFTLVEDDCRQYVASFSSADGKMSETIAGDRSFSILDPHPSGSWMVAMSTPQMPTEYYALESGNLRRITTQQDKFLDSLVFSKVERVVSKSKDGTSVSSMLFLPPNKPATKLPTLFIIHGGPVAQDEFAFDISRQLYSAAGYAVVAVNYRGSSGKGIEFTKSISGDWGNKEVKDILGSVDNLIAKGIADPDRLGIGGWSYGGILTDYIIASDKRFKAAISGAGSALQLSMYGVDQYILQLDNELGSPWKGKNLEKYLKISYPFLHADRIKTPTLFMVGEKDFNVPAVGSEQMYQALRSQGIETGLIIYPGQFHGISLPSFVKDRHKRYLEWFGKYLKP